MVDYFKAAEELEWIAKKFSGLLSVAEEFKRLGSMKNATSEIEMAFAKKNSAMAALESGLTSKQAAIEAEMASIARREVVLRDEMKAREAIAAGVEAGAIKQAERIVAQANEDAVKIVQAASDKVHVVHAEGRALRAKAQDAVDKLEEARKTLQAEIVELNGEKDRIATEIRALKSKFA